MEITVRKPNWFIIIAFIFGLCMMLIGAIGAALRAEPLPLLPAVAEVEVFIVTITADDGATRRVLKRDTNRVTRLLNEDGYIKATAGTNESLNEYPKKPSFLMFAQWVIDPEDNASYLGVMASVAFVDSSGATWLVLNYALEEPLDTPEKIIAARRDLVELMRHVLAPSTGQYWL
jgi:hypothetical protein